MRMVTYGCLHVLVCTLTSHKRYLRHRSSFLIGERQSFK